MTTATRTKKRFSPAAAVAFARKKAADGATWVDVHNALFGIGGKCASLSDAERHTFVKSREYAEIQRIMDAIPNFGLKVPEASGRLLVRLPKSLHAALMAEAESEGTSVNQLIVSKLSAQLKSVVFPKKR